MKTIIILCVILIHIEPSLAQISLDCTYVKDVTLSFNGLKGEKSCCVLNSTLKISEPNTEISIKNKPENIKKKLDDINCIKIENIEMNFLPHGFNNSFKIIEGLRIASTQLLEINKEDLEQFPKLKDLNIMYNKIKTIKKDLFQFNPDLVSINFYKNNLKDIDTRSFENLHKLNSLTLINNNCTSAGTKQFLEDKISFIADIKSKCFTPEFQLKVEMSELQEEIKEISSKIAKYHQINSKVAEMKEKIEIFEKAPKNLEKFTNHVKEEMIKNINERHSNLTKILENLKDGIKIDQLNKKFNPIIQQILNNLATVNRNLKTIEQNVKHVKSSQSENTDETSFTEIEDSDDFTNIFNRYFEMTSVFDDSQKYYDKSEMIPIIYKKLKNFKETMLISMIFSSIGTILITSVLITCIMKRMKNDKIRNESTQNENHNTRQRINHDLNNDDELITNHSEVVSIKDEPNFGVTGNFTRVEAPIYAEVNKEAKRNRRPQDFY
ncbi:hypothetical protein PVAND_016887 [Polypedilum vanderplanki]|uniref:Uncharacterized protein n=1 Tax=Polypedilum vanderplanki TaxID=319348 RepID=A0A9J6BH42_POLVA|nr:hypothetical protein PVAND_016887 [Polypedilum vanderplanki]